MKTIKLLPLFLCPFVSLLAADAETNFLKASADLDKALIPALIDTKRGDVSGSATSVARLVSAWNTYQEEEGENLAKASGWSLVQNGITRRLNMAERFVAGDDIGMAHLMLEQVRNDLVLVRESLGSPTFADLLVGYHDLMEAVLGEDTVPLADRETRSLIEEVDELRDAWDGVESTELNAEAYGFRWSDTEALDDLMAAEDKAIDALADAIRRGQVESYDELAGNIRRCFMQTYLFFAAEQ